ncbi:hypothetical protein BD413DRAFT_628064 [Trametes elegans]|nr:hypothetical protein BD413DRAFT_628064 [Trametes elegans]
MMHLLNFILAALAASGALAVPVENVSEPSSTSVASDSVAGGHRFIPWQTTTSSATHTVVSRAKVSLHVRDKSVESSVSASSTSVGTAFSSSSTLGGASPIIVSEPVSSATPSASPGSTDISSSTPGLNPRTWSWPHGGRRAKGVPDIATGYASSVTAATSPAADTPSVTSTPSTLATSSKAL